MSNTTKLQFPTELRVWIKCKEEKEIVQRKPNAKNNICKECTNEAAKEYARVKAIKDGKRIGQRGRLPYPGGFEEVGREKLLLRKKELDKIKDREEWVKLIRERFEQIINDVEVMDYINLRGEYADVEDNRKTREEKDDFQYLTWDDFERGGWGNPEDS